MGYMDLKAQAKTLGIKQRTLAAEFGVSEATISNWLNRVYAPPTHYLRPLSDALHVPIEELLPAREEAGE